MLQYRGRRDEWNSYFTPCYSPAVHRTTAGHSFFDGLRETPKQLILQTERRVQPRALHDTSYFSFDGFERLAEAPSAGNS